MLKIIQSCKHLVRLCGPKYCTLFENVSIYHNKNSFLWNTVQFTEVNYYNTNVEGNLRDGEDYNEVDIQAITKGDAELEHKLKVIILEAEVMRQEGRSIPSNSFLKTRHWEELLKFDTRSARKKYLQFLFKNEKIRENKLLKKEKKRTDREQQPKKETDEEDDGHIKYELGYNNIFLRFYDTTINHLYNSKLVEAMQFGQQLVVDCGYDKNMTTRENINCAKQLMFVFAENRFHEDPFDLHFCNCDFQNTLMKYLHQHIKTMYEPWFPLNLHEQSYLDIYPKEQLVYLTPHCREEMKKFDHDAVYIIGGIVDKVNNEPLSLAKAKQEGLRMMKLPLDRYLQWGSGSGKSLTLNQITSILLDVKRTGDWKYSLRHVPKRKLTYYDVNSNDRQHFRDSQHSRRDNRKWKPNNNFELSYNNSKQERTDSVRKKLIHVRSIFNE